VSLVYLACVCFVHIMSLVHCLICILSLFHPSMTHSALFNYTKTYQLLLYYHIYKTLNSSLNTHTKTWIQCFDFILFKAL